MTRTTFLLLLIILMAFTAVSGDEDGATTEPTADHDHSESTAPATDAPTEAATTKPTTTKASGSKSTTPANEPTEPEAESETTTPAKKSKPTKSTADSGPQLFGIQILPFSDMEQGLHHGQSVDVDGGQGHQVYEEIVEEEIDGESHGDDVPAHQMRGLPGVGNSTTGLVTTATPDKPTAGPTVKNKTWIWVLLFLGVILLIIIIAIVVSRLTRKPEKEHKVQEVPMVAVPVDPEVAQVVELVPVVPTPEVPAQA